MRTIALAIIGSLLLAGILLSGCASIRKSALYPNSFGLQVSDPTLFITPPGFSHFQAIGGGITFTWQLKPTPTRPLGPYSIPVNTTAPLPAVPKP